jgi:hypothetical protein
MGRSERLNLGSDLKSPSLLGWHQGLQQRTTTHLRQLSPPFILPEVEIEPSGLISKEPE